MADIANILKSSEFDPNNDFICTNLGEFKSTGVKWLDRVIVAILNLVDRCGYDKHQVARNIFKELNNNKKLEDDDLRAIYGNLNQLVKRFNFEGAEGEEFQKCLGVFRSRIQSNETEKKGAASVLVDEFISRNSCRELKQYRDQLIEHVKNMKPEDASVFLKKFATFQKMQALGKEFPESVLVEVFGRDAMAPIFEFDDKKNCALKELDEKFTGVSIYNEKAFKSLPSPRDFMDNKQTEALFEIAPHVQVNEELLSKSGFANVRKKCVEKSHELNVRKELNEIKKGCASDLYTDRHRQLASDRRPQESRTDSWDGLEAELSEWKIYENRLRSAFIYDAKKQYKDSAFYFDAIAEFNGNPTTFDQWKKVVTNIETKRAIKAPKDIEQFGKLVKFVSGGNRQAFEVINALAGNRYPVEQMEDLLRQGELKVPSSSEFFKFLSGEISEIYSKSEMHSEEDVKRVVGGLIDYLKGVLDPKVIEAIVTQSLVDFGVRPPYENLEKTIAKAIVLNGILDIEQNPVPAFKDFLQILQRNLEKFSAEKAQMRRYEGAFNEEGIVLLFANVAMKNEKKPLALDAYQQGSVMPPSPLEIKHALIAEVGRLSKPLPNETLLGFKERMFNNLSVIVKPSVLENLKGDRVLKECKTIEAFTKALRDKIFALEFPYPTTQARVVARPETKGEKISLQMPKPTPEVNRDPVMIGRYQKVFKNLPENENLEIQRAKHLKALKNSDNAERYVRDNFTSEAASYIIAVSKKKGGDLKAYSETLQGLPIDMTNIEVLFKMYA